MLHSVQTGEDIIPSLVDGCVNGDALLIACDTQGKPVWSFGFTYVFVNELLRSQYVFYITDQSLMQEQLPKTSGSI